MGKPAYRGKSYTIVLKQNPVNREIGQSGNPSLDLSHSSVFNCTVLTLTVEFEQGLFVLNGHLVLR